MSVTFYYLPKTRAWRKESVRLTLCWNQRHATETKDSYSIFFFKGIISIIIPGWLVIIRLQINQVINHDFYFLARMHIAKGLACQWFKHESWTQCLLALGLSLVCGMYLVYFDLLPTIWWTAKPMTHCDSVFIHHTALLSLYKQYDVIKWESRVGRAKHPSLLAPQWTIVQCPPQAVIVKKKGSEWISP